MSDALALIDPGAVLARPDLAELAVEGLVRADTYRATEARRCAVATAEILDAPQGARIDQLVFGEIFDVLDARGDAVWGRARRDGVIGWVSRAALNDAGALPTHRIKVARAEVFATPDGGRPLTTLSLNALVRRTADRQGVVQVEGLGWIAAADLADFNEFDSDLATAAERLTGVAHVPGGRSSQGTDCSGLVQQALYACGLAGPRYAYQQALLGRAVETPGRGDLIVWGSAAVQPWGGHAGVMLDANRLIHASGVHGAVVVETLAEADARYRAAGFDAPVFRRVIG